MIVYTIDYIIPQKPNAIHYLKMNGDFGLKPYRYFDGDGMYPDYYHAKWMDPDELVQTLKSLPLLKTNMGEIIRYRIIELNVRFKRYNLTKVPKWTSKVIGPW